MSGKFTIGGREYDHCAPKGKAGRRATAFVLSRFGHMASGGEQDMSGFIGLLGDEEFEKHLPALLSVDADVLEKEGNLGEILQAVIGQINLVFEALGTDEVSAALKNSAAAQEVKGEE